MTDASIVCAKCGATRGAGAYCPDCGSPLMAQPALSGQVGGAAGWVQRAAPKSGGGKSVLGRLLLVVVVLVVVAVLAATGNAGKSAGPASTPAGYAGEYGGNPDVYREIAAETDCAALQASFDLAAANNDAAEPGTAAHKSSLGFMLASGDRMEAIGCY